MNTEWQADVCEGYRTKVITVGRCTIEINRPVLTDEERKRREDQVIEAIKRFGKG